MKKITAKELSAKLASLATDPTALATMAAAIRNKAQADPTRLQGETFQELRESAIVED